MLGLWDHPNHLEHLPVIWATGFEVWNRSLVLRAKHYKYLVLLKPLSWITEGGLFCEPPGKEENSLWNFSLYILRTQSSKTRCVLLESLNFDCLLKDPVSNQLMICDKTHDGGGHRKTKCFLRLLVSEILILCWMALLLWDCSHRNRAWW